MPQLLVFSCRFFNNILCNKPQKQFSVRRKFKDHKDEITDPQ